ncbi:YecA family protein [Alkalihalobacillus sp. BA299]|uniref:YecA family protein n=1 Tax=Alkalihalobacillus sp. BA299 TaxID=2815938 RepID=UPI001AD95753|nr:SEC-C metal-binding domain-containing protein [Alkalihalobacillus sp. BA299]
MRENRELETEEFDLSLKAYVNYVNRQMKKDEDYIPHPLVKALMVAVNGAVENGKPGRYAGASGDAEYYEDNEARKSFICAIEYNEDKTITLLEFHDLTLGCSVPIKVASYILLLSMRLDGIKGSMISIEDMINIINDTIPTLNLIRFNNDEWLEARDFLAKNLDTIGGFPEGQTEEYEKDLLSIKENTPWEEYPPRVRMLVATTYVREKYPDLFKKDCVNNVCVILDEYLPKIRVMNDTLTILYGPPSSYFDDILNWNHFSDVKTDNSLTSRKKYKIGRNEKCPCNSGKKYKVCCGKL